MRDSSQHTLDPELVGCSLNANPGACKRNDAVSLFMVDVELRLIEVRSMDRVDSLFTNLKDR